MDCFAFAYAVRRHLLSEFPDAVEDVALALAELPSTLGEDYTNLTAHHVYAWITFADTCTCAGAQAQCKCGYVAALDLTPLAADAVNPHHAPIMLGNHAAGLDSQFETWRRRVPLRTAQPMHVVEKDGRLYCLMAAVNILDDEYQFTLRAYEIQPATSNRQLEFTCGALAGLRFKRADFAQVQAMVRDDGPTAFHKRSDLLIRKGDPEPDLAAVLDDHLFLFWHLVTKLQPPE
jgi:hypothetical protein